MATVVRMPQLAAGGSEAAIQSWLVGVGDGVSRGQAIVEIETEKAVVEYEAEADGILAGILVAAGDSAAVGAPIAVLASDGESAEYALRSVGEVVLDAATRSADVEAERSPASRHVVSPETATSGESPLSVADRALADRGQTERAPADERLFASPLVRRLARERGIDLMTIPGSGPNGRIVRRDLDALPPAAAPPAAASAAEAMEASGGFTDIPHTRMRRAIARRLTESTVGIPHFFVAADCRVDELLALRAQINARTAHSVSLNDFVLKAVAGAMRDVPEANAIWTDEAVRRFDHADIAIAVSVEDGLVTPVVRGVDTRSLGELSAAVRDLVTRAREGRITQPELEGGSFTVSNLGMLGATEFTAIINPPHSGILAVGAATRRPIATEDGELAVGTVMTVTLSADHRVLDGAVAARWLAAFVDRIENPIGILL